MPELWLKIWFDKQSQHYTRVRNHLNAPGKWSRLPEPIKNYQIVKRIALETLMTIISRSQRVA
jgi:hypothetical protein